MTGVQEPALELQPNVRIDRYSVSLLPPGHPQYRYYAITVERRQPNTAGHVWALTDGSHTFGRGCRWDVEYQPDAAWLDRHRFPLAEAMALAKQECRDITYDGIRTAADVAAEWHQTTVEQM
jgi:hypothetical protein